jgi:hypothetical protein
VVLRAAALRRGAAFFAAGFAAAFFLRLTAMCVESPFSG